MLRGLLSRTLSPPPDLVRRAPPTNLLERIQQGDDDALREAWRRHAPTALTLAHRIIEPPRSMQVVEECFLLLWRRPERYAGAPLDALMARAVRDVAIAVRRGRPIRDAVDAWSAPILPPSPTDGAALSEIDPKIVRRAVARLPQRQRTALELAWIDGLDVEVIGAQLQIDAAAVDQALDDALETIAAALETESRR